MTKKPRLSKEQIRQRKEFCNRWINIEDDDLHFWVFSDETRINISESDGAVRVLRRTGEELLPECIVSTEKFGGGSVSFWGCIGLQPGVLVQYDGPLTSEKYCDLLHDNMDEALINMFSTVDDEFVLYQDGASWHTSKVVKYFFEEKEWTVITGPPNSPDLNLIENVWGYIKKKMAEYQTKASSLEELADRFRSQFFSIPSEVISAITHSFRNRLEAVRKAKGKNTKY